MFLINQSRQPLKSFLWLPSQPSPRPCRCGACCLQRCRGRWPGWGWGLGLGLGLGAGAGGWGLGMRPARPLPLGPGGSACPGTAPCLSFPPSVGCFGDAPAAVRVQSPRDRTFSGRHRGDHKSLLSRFPPLRARRGGNRGGGSGCHPRGTAVPAWCVLVPAQTRPVPHQGRALPMPSPV